MIRASAPAAFNSVLALLYQVVVTTLETKAFLLAELMSVFYGLSAEGDTLCNAVATPLMEDAFLWGGMLRLSFGSHNPDWWSSLG